MNPKSNKEEEKKYKGLIYGMTFGMLGGSIIGSITDTNIGLACALGICFGFGVGVIYDGLSNNPNT